MPKREVLEELKNLAVGHREREYDRILTKGMENATDAQLLEDLLFYPLPRIDTKPLARLLIGRFKTFARVLKAEERELTEISGVGKRTAAFLKLLCEACNRYDVSALTGMAELSRHSEVIDYIIKHLKDLEREQVHLLILDNRYRLVEHEVMSVGTDDRVNVDVRRLCEKVLRAGCRNAVLAHNHPSGRANPSLQDDRLTDQVLKAFSVVGINLLDHVIVGYHSDCYSYRSCSGEFACRMGLQANTANHEILDGAEFIYDMEKDG